MAPNSVGEIGAFSLRPDAIVAVTEGAVRFEGELSKLKALALKDDLR